MFHETIWFLRGDTNIKYLEDNNAPIWRPDAFQDNLPKMVKAGVFPEGLVKYSPDWDKAMEEYGQRIREDAEFAAKDGEMQGPSMASSGEGGNISTMTKAPLSK